MDKLIAHRGTALGWPPAGRGVGLHVAERRQYTGATTGMVALLLFALVTFLYGVHLDRRFMGVGVFLGLSYVVMSYMAAYIWILLLIAALMVAVAIFMMKRTYSKQAAAGPARTPPVLLQGRADEDFVQEAQPGPRQRERESRK
jgi:hypothetical protein